MKISLPILFSFLIIISGCSTPQEPYFQGSNFAIMDIYEGTNKYYIPAIIIRTDEKFNEAEAVKTRDYIASNKDITRHHLTSSTIVFKQKKEVYAILTVDTYEKPFENVFLSIDSIKNNITRQFNQKKEKPNIEDCYLYLGTNNFNQKMRSGLVYYMLTPKETLYREDSLNAQYVWGNSTGYYDEVLERGDALLLREFSYSFTFKGADRLIRLESGDILRYSF